MATLMLNENSEAAKQGGFSVQAVTANLLRFDSLMNWETGEEQFVGSRLKALKKYCGVEPGGFRYHPNGYEDTEKMKTDFAKHNVAQGDYKQPQSFQWSGQWPDGARRPQDGENTTIQAHWQVELDVSVTVSRLNILGVLKFKDAAGCCTLTATMIFVGPYFGRLEAGTPTQPFEHGMAKIILKGHPGTPPPQTWKPQIMGAATFLQSKFIAVQGTLSLHGKAAGNTWTKLASKASAGDTTLTVQTASIFKTGDIITVHEGEKHTITAVSGNTLTLNGALKRDYYGISDMHPTGGHRPEG
jgi:hypothetical protein